MQDKDKDRHPYGTDPGGWRSGGGTRPAHWQGEEVPYGQENQPQRVQFDQRGAGRAQQYGEAGVYGRRHDEAQRRPPRSYAASDDALLNEVCDRLSRSRVDVRAVTVSVREGVVRLGGEVASEEQKILLEQLVANCPGTVDVRNHLHAPVLPESQTRGTAPAAKNKD